jgi:hypothetical protein
MMKTVRQATCSNLVLRYTHVQTLSLRQNHTHACLIFIKDDYYKGARISMCVSV